MTLSRTRVPALLISTVMASVLLTGCGTLGIGKSKAESNARAVSKAQAPNMGVTDWYASAEAPNERFKANVYILDTNLRADALKTSIFKQTRTAGGWQDASVDADTARQILNLIEFTS